MKILVRFLDSTSIIVDFNDSMSLSDLKAKIPSSKFDMGTWVVGLAGQKAIIWSDPSFKAQIIKQKKISQLNIAKGGVDRIDIILGEIKDCIEKISPTYKTTSTCSVCEEDNISCFKLHNGETCRVCKTCLFEHLNNAEKINHNSLDCVCGIRLKTSDLESHLPDEFGCLVSDLNETRKLQRLMQWQIHSCGAILRLKTTYSKQQCNLCKKTLCIFCNGEWNANRKNAEYSCHNECFYEEHAASGLQLVSWSGASDTSKKIPPSRFCPKCISITQYAKKCKNHTCSECKYTFCFICLRPQYGPGKCEASYYEEHEVATQTLPDLYKASLEYETIIESENTN